MQTKPCRSYLGIFVASVLATASAPAQTLTEALDLPGATWTTSGLVPVVPQTAVTHDNVDAVSFAFPTPFTNYDFATIQTVVNGPGTLRFWWKVSNTTNAQGYLSQANISANTGENWPYSDSAYAAGNLDWTEVELQVMLYGPNVITFNATRYYAYDLGMDGAWIDDVRFTPSTPVAPAITNQPSSQVSFAGGTAKLSVGMDGTPPFAYQWRFQNTPIAEATNSTFSLNNLALTNAGDYDVVITNLLGARTSSVAKVTVLPGISIPEALDAPDLAWFSTGPGLWFGQTNTTRDGVDALQTGASNEPGDVALWTTVNGPGTISFWWMCDFFPGFSFEITNANNSVFWTNIYHITDWNKPEITVGPGQHTLIWAFWTSPHGGHGEFDSKAAIDQVVWKPLLLPPGPTLLHPKINAQGQFEFSLQTVNNKHYFVEFKNSLSDAWQPYYDFFGDGSVVPISEFMPASGQRFFQVREE